MSEQIEETKSQVDISSQQEQPQGSSLRNSRPDSNNTQLSLEEEMQQYLCNEILHKGYDGEQFRQWLQLQHPGAEEQLTLLNMEELKKITEGFILAQEEQQKSQVLSGSQKSSVAPQQSLIQAAGNKPKAALPHRSSVFTLPQNGTNNFALNSSARKITVNQKPSDNKSLAPQDSLDTTISVVTSNSRGDTIVRKETQIIPETSVVRDAFIKKNLEGEESSKIISCRTVENSKLSDFFAANPNSPPIKVIIEKYQVVFDGVFSSEYALYEVSTPLLNWQVNRRFSDFEWLYTSLKKHYPGQMIPPIARKTTIKEMGEQHLYERMRAFEQFLNQVLLSPILRVTTHVSEFLSIADQKTFEAKRKEFNAKIEPTTVDSIFSIGGSLISEITPQLKDFWMQFADQTEKSLLHYEGLTEQFDALTKSLLSASENSNRVAVNFSRMYKVHEQYNKLSPLGKVPILEKINANFNNFFVDLSSSISAISTALEKNIGEYLRYHKQIIEEFKLVTQTRTNQQNNYLEKLRKLTAKKEKLFATGTTAKWEIPSSCSLTIRELQANKIEAFKYMLPNETNQVIADGEMFGYINKNLYEDVSLHLGQSSNFASKRFIDLSQDLALQINKLHIQIAESNMQFAELLGFDHSSLNHRYKNDE